MKRLMVTLACLFGFITAPARAADVIGPVAFTFNTGLYMVLYVDEINFIHGTAVYNQNTSRQFVEPVAGKYLPGIGINLSLGAPIANASSSLYMNGDGSAQNEVVTIDGSLGGGVLRGNPITWRPSDARGSPDHIESSGIPPTASERWTALGYSQPR